MSASLGHWSERSQENVRTQRNVFWLQTICRQNATRKRHWAGNSFACTKVQKVQSKKEAEGHP